MSLSPLNAVVCACGGGGGGTCDVLSKPVIGLSPNSPDGRADDGARSFPKTTVQPE